METKIKWLGDLSLAGLSGTGHWVPMDAKATYGGNGGGASPMELILLGLGGCTSMDILSILKKKRVDLHDYAVEISAENADEHPKVYTKINIHFKFHGNGIRENDVQRAIELSETKYCSVSAMLKKTAEIITSFEILEPEKRF